MAPQFYIALATAMILMVVALYALGPTAKFLKLVDHPDNTRKLHNGSVPLTGGIALLATLAIVLSVFDAASPSLTHAALFWPIIAACLTGLVLLHAIDDVIELRAITRFGIDAMLAFFIALYALVRLTTLGDLFGMGEVTLGRFSLLMTVFCFVAASNAFNMTDGIDSLCTGLGIVCFATIIALIGLNAGSNVMIAPLAIVIAALIPLYIANLGLLGARMRTFLGDSGARLIGFIAAIALISAAQQGMIRPVTAFFAIAVPVCDCVLLMGWRLAHRRSPLSADRLHLHHLLLDAGLTQSQSRRLILTLAVVFGLVGIAFEWSGTPTWIVSAFVVASFFGFIGFRLWLAMARTREEARADTKTTSREEHTRRAPHPAVRAPAEAPALAQTTSQDEPAPAQASATAARQAQQA